MNGQQTDLYLIRREEEYKKLRDELETERIRLAACGAAALGYFNGCADEYRSASLDDVLRLRAELEAVKKRLCEAEAAELQWMTYRHVVNRVEDLEKQLAILRKELEDALKRNTVMAQQLNEIKKEQG